jgi:hypothetical protein
MKGAFWLMVIGAVGSAGIAIGLGHAAKQKGQLVARTAPATRVDPFVAPALAKDTPRAATVKR